LTTKSDKNTLAFDKASARSFDTDGRLHVSKTPISKANVCPYLGREIPRWQELGLQPDKIYQMYRDPVELEKSASTFNNLPLLQKHIPVSADAPMKEHVVGTIGSDVTYEEPYLMASLCAWDAEAIAGIESEKIDELSSAYHYDADMTAGTTPEGESYDGRMTNIRGNHVALVDVGRAGPDVVVADRNPFVAPPTTTVKETEMKKTKLGRALMVALSAASPKIAQDAALPSVVVAAVKGKFNKAEAVKKLLAMDEELDVEKVDEIVDAILGVEETPEPKEPEFEGAGDEDDGGAKSKHAEIIDYLRGKGLSTEDLEAVGNMITRLDRPFAKDEDLNGYVKEEEVKTAMDSLRGDLLKQFKDLEAAKSQVRSVVGDVIGMDSAEEVYRFALDHIGVDHKDMPKAGLSKLFAVAAERKSQPQVKIAQDSANIEARIPGLKRLTNY
jgi:hypothetical protein